MARKVIELSGDIGGWSYDGTHRINAEWLKEQLAGLTEEDEAYLTVDSFGGDVLVGYAMASLLQSCPAKTIYHIYAASMSMSTSIGAVCDESYQVPMSLYMIHKASLQPNYGHSKDLEANAELLRAVDDNAAELYAKKTGMSKDRIIKEFMTGYDRYLTPKEALSYGFIDGIRDPLKGTIQSSNSFHNRDEFEIYFKKAEDAEMKERPLILNQFINKSNVTKMENKKEVPTETAEVKDDVVKNIIPKKEAGKFEKLSSSLADQAKNLRETIVAKTDSITLLSRDNELLSAKIAELEKDANEKDLAVKSTANDNSVLMDAKDKELKEQDTDNRIKLAVSYLKGAFPLLSLEKEQAITEHFPNRNSISIDGKTETVIDKSTNKVVGTDIRSAVQAFAINSGYVDAPKSGLGTSPNLSNSNSLPKSFADEVEADESKRIISKQRELEKQGIKKFTPTYNSIMLDVFNGSTNKSIVILKNLK